ncbi:MAG: hypothetical protein M3132_11875 [Actinomycetia bacterium]|nr:hypothetical protein [Actinomycetes bacterium]
MLEMTLAAVFVTVALVAMGGKRVAPQGSASLIRTAIDDSSDLPCPWCLAQTREADNHCPTCGQRFG